MSEQAANVTLDQAAPETNGKQVLVEVDHLVKYYAVRGGLLQRVSGWVKAGLGMQGYQQRMGIGQAQLGAGAQGQALEQELLNQQYQDFINQQQFPYKQAEFGMGILRGIPATGQVGTFYQRRLA